MMPITMPGLSALKPASPGRHCCSSGVTNSQREVAVDDRRHAGQDLEHRLDDAAHAVGARTRSGRSRSAGPSAAPRPSRSPRPASCPPPAAARRSAGSRTAASTRCRSGTRAIDTSRRNATVSTARTTMMPAVVPHREHRAQEQQRARSAIRPGGWTSGGYLPRLAGQQLLDGHADLRPAVPNTEPVRARLVKCSATSW